MGGGGGGRGGGEGGGHIRGGGGGMGVATSFMVSEQLIQYPKPKSLKGAKFGNKFNSIQSYQTKLLICPWAAIAGRNEWFYKPLSFSLHSKNCVGACP